MEHTGIKTNGISTIIARLSVRKLIQAAMLSAVLILMTVSTLAVREWYIYTHCSRLLEQSRLIQVHFTELSDFITEQLLAGRIVAMAEVEREAAIIREKSSKIAGHALVPTEFKLLLVGGSDLTKLMTRVRLLSTESERTESHLTVYRILRGLNGRIRAFNDGFGKYVQQQLQTVQNLLRGFLALATVFLTTLLFLLHAHVIRPFFQLVKDLRRALGKNAENLETVDSILSITNLGYHIRHKLAACTGNTPFTLEELRAISHSLLNEHPPYRECPKIMNHVNGIINCAQILQDQLNVASQEDENRKLLSDLWESGKKIAETVTHLRHLQQIHTAPATSVEDAIALLISWLELQYPEISQILQEKTVPALSPVQIPGRDLFLSLALLTEQVIPKLGSDCSSAIFSKLQIAAYAKSETETIIELVLVPQSVELPISSHDATTQMRQLICNALLHCHGSTLEVSRAKDQTLSYHFLLR